MPTNLNALIRYKKIDECLRSQYLKATVERLQEACSEQLAEHRGVYKLVSERTIRDDIRVMRSDALGFNAPIEIQDGVYFYSDKNYSIFQTPLIEKSLLRELLVLLVTERKNIQNPAVDKMIQTLSFKIKNAQSIQSKSNSESVKELPVQSGRSLLVKYSMSPDENYFEVNQSKTDIEPKIDLNWSDIYNVLIA